MKKYLKIISKSFQKQAAYKVEYFVGLLNGLLFIFIFTSLWRAIYSHAGSGVLRRDFDLRSLLSYAVLAMVLKISFSMDDNATAFKMRTGALIMDLIKPVSYYFLYFAESLGYSLFHLFARGAPLLILSIFLFDIRVPASPGNYALLLCSASMGYSIFFNINYLTGLLSFWFIETFSFQLMKYGLFTLFAGGVLPLDFFPDSVRPFAELLPFPYILYTPTALFIGHVPPGRILSSLFVQFLWFLLLSLFSRVAWKAALKRLVAQGG